MSKICTNCNAKNPDEAKFCRKCGKQDFTVEKLINNKPTDKFENMTELDMFFSNDFTEKKKKNSDKKKSWNKWKNESKKLMKH